MQHLLGAADRLAVIDVETTGLGASDEIVELAVVTLDGTGAEVAVLDTLVRASRPIGPGASQVNGLRDVDLTEAPTFVDLAGEVARHLHGAVVVAHNAAFDLRMIAAAFRRVGSRLTVEQPVDTYRLTRMTLERSLAVHGIPAIDLHRALGDVRATAELLRRIAADLTPGTPAHVTPLPSPSGVEPVSRPGRPGTRGPSSSSAGSGIPHRAPGERVRMPRSTSGRSGGASVDMDDESLLRARKPVDVRVELTPGAHVVLSTLSTHSKAEVTAHATSLGLVVKPEVSKQTVLLVTDDLDAPSRRARKARELRVPIALATDLLACRKGQSVAARGDAG